MLKWEQGLSPKDRVFIDDAKMWILENLIIIKNQGDNQVIIKLRFSIS